LSIETIYDVLTSLEKIGQVTDLELENVDGQSMSSAAHWKGMDVELMDVSFSYPDHGKYTLQDLNLKIEEGSRILITGPNGSGKSTLLQVIAGLYYPQSGNIAYDGSPIGSLNINDLQSVIGDCLSQEQLFQGTILENITMGRSQATAENIRWAVTNLGLAPFIKSLEKGYDTMVGPQGQKLPGSIKQKLILARSIADRPRLLLLEDALEHLDEQEQRRIINFLFDPQYPWTVVAVSGSTYMAEKASRTIVMEEGKVIGNRDRGLSNETGI
jgi:ABC-type bacteriocin/lantibiotic exporter with double-glycine peptidase domain